MYQNNLGCSDNFNLLIQLFNSAGDGYIAETQFKSMNM